MLQKQHCDWRVTAMSLLDPQVSNHQNSPRRERQVHAIPRCRDTAIPAPIRDSLKETCPSPTNAIKRKKLHLSLIKNQKFEDTDWA
jgi:hypothetical protein